MLLFPMVTVGKHPRPPLLRELSALCVKIPILTFRTVPQESRPVSLFPAIHTDALTCKCFACRSYESAGGGTLPLKIFSLFFSILAAHHSSFVTKSFIIHTYGNSARNSFTIRTSKMQELKSFRIRTYEKTQGGGPPQPVPFPLRPKHVRNIQVLPF